MATFKAESHQLAASGLESSHPRVKLGFPNDSGFSDSTATLTPNIRDAVFSDSPSNSSNNVNVNLEPVNNINSSLVSSRLTFECVHASSLSTERESIHRVMENLKILVSYALLYRNRRYLDRAVAILMDKKHDASTSKDLNFALALRRKLKSLPAPTCHQCKIMSGDLMACLHCSFCGCREELHGKNHFLVCNHLFALNLNTCKIYCNLCEDYVTNTARIRGSNGGGPLRSILEEEICKAKNVLSWAVRVSRRPISSGVRLPISAVRISPYLLKNNPSPRVLHRANGLNGLFNLGNTCFMNCILQATIHNRLLQDYFLSHRHADYDSCKFRLKNGGICLACELSKLFFKFFENEKSLTISPHEFLYAVWKSSKELAGYEQQDAHEFFISIMNGIHVSCCTLERPNISGCSCIVHRVFCGLLESNISCAQCGYVTSTLDPFFDISLDFRKDYAASHSLVDCLKRYTLPEKLSGSAYLCSNCKASQRFEHSSNAAKIDVPIRFPTELCMSPFMTQVLRRGNQGEPSAAMIWDSTQSLLNSYKLYAVIAHVGTMDTGHYTAYICHRDKWYHMDDQLVSEASVVEVLQSHAYMLFYAKKTIICSS